MSNIEQEEHYELNWKGKHNAISEAFSTSKSTMEECKQDSKNWDTTGNLYIEGDSIDALKLLQDQYENKIKMIYIDPPYNTKTRKIYNDNFHTNLKGYVDKHSKWLNMMYPRLMLAKKLLRDDGVIFISIDDHEMHNLIAMGDEIFGDKNRLGVVTVVHKPEGRNQAKFFAPSSEFMIIYSKKSEIASFNHVVLDEEIKKTFDKIDSFGKYRLNNYLRSGGGDHNLRVNKPNFFYSIFFNPKLNEVSLENKNGYIEILPTTNKGQERTWKTIKETFLERLKQGNIVIEKNTQGKFQIFEKYREKQLLKTHWQQPKYHATHHGTNLVSKLLGGSFFDFPKSIYLVKDILKITTNPNDLILDFFSGSATTAHAVMQLNAEDGGNRKFIMVQLPEICGENSEAYKAGYKTIAEIGKERIRRAGNKIITELEEKNHRAELEVNKLDIGFRVYKIKLI